ncbi:MAG: molybdate ABC transporter substrate-binding protein [Deltaproteobacteria bacterium]|nr:molybdate ABC transporter substrate-binding protein [Deltaproteobacteria bacterium]
MFRPEDRALTGLLSFLLCTVLWGVSATESLSSETEPLELFAGSASQPAIEEAARVFEAKTGIRVNIHFGGSGRMLSQMKLSQRGDLYLPGSSDFMELAKKDKLILEDTEKTLAYLIPAINVPRGNPKGIRSLEDLAKPGTRVGIARPDTVCVGLYGAEILEKNGLARKVRNNIRTYAPSCAKLAQLVSLGYVDAALGWRVFAYWRTGTIETVLLRPEQIPRIGYIPIAVSSFTERIETARSFITFLLSKQGKEVFGKWHYLVREQDARRFVLAECPIGGAWALPESWE